MNKPKKASGIFVGTAALALLVAVSAPPIGQEPVPLPHARPAPEGQTLSAITQEHRVLTLPEPIPTPVGKETSNTEPNSTPPTGIAFEPQKPNATTEILTANEPPRDKPTPELSPPKITATVMATEPQMGDTRIVDGQKQVYFLGFGWIEDNDMPNECEYAEDMYENGNKIGSMGGGTFVDGEGDINKMVGTMDAGETGRSCGDINK